MKKSKYLLAITVIAASMSGMVYAKSNNDWQHESQTRKADYIYLEALRQSLRSAEDASYELIQRSYQLNPSDDYVGWEKGVSMIRLSGGDSATVENGMELMGNYVEQNPDDLYSSLILANLFERVGKRDRQFAIWKSLHEQFPTRPEVTLKYAEALATSPYSEGREKALALYDSIEVMEGKNIPITNQKMKIYFADRDTAGILNEARLLVASSPNTLEYNVFAGDIFGQFSSRDSALSYYDRALEIDPASGLAHYSRANFFRIKNDSVAYDREVFQALKQPDLDIAPKLEILQGYISELYTDPAQRQRIGDLFKVLIDLHPHETDIFRLYTEYLIAVEDYKGAAEQADNALSLDPSDEKEWLRLGSLYIKANEPKEALESARRARRYFPTNPSFPLFIGVSLSQLKQYDEALEALKTSKELTDSADKIQQSNILTLIGDTYYAAGKSDTAYVYYKDALRADPENPTVLNNCAYYMANTGQDLEKALEMITRCLELRPDDPNSLDTFAWVLFKLKRYQEAKDVIDRLLAKDADEDEEEGEPTGEGEDEEEERNSEELYSRAGDIYFMNGDSKEALDFWKRALKINPDNELLQRKVRHKTFFYE